MRKLMIVALAALSIAGSRGYAADADKDVGGDVLKAGEIFDHDAQKVGSAIKSVSSEIKIEIASGAVEIATGPAGETIMMVGDVTLDAAQAIAGQYEQTEGALKCVAGDPLNPFKDSGCVVKYAGQTLALAVATASNGSTTLIVAAADALGEAFNGFERVMTSAAHATGGLTNPVGAFFVLAYELTKAGETVLHFGLIDVGARTVSILAEEGTSIVSAPMGALFDVVTLKWKRAGVKLVNLPEHLANSVINIPVRLIFGKKKKDVVLRTLSPLGRWINHTLGLNSDKVNQLENQE